MKIKVGDNEVVLDPKHLQVDETNLNEFLKKFAGIYNHYNTLWATAQYLQHISEDKYDTISSERFQWYKDNEGGSDKLVEAKVRVHDQVVKAKKASRDARYITQLLFCYLRALDKAHENVLNLGYNIRKEMDKLYPQTIKGLEEDVDAKVAKLFEDND